MTEEADGKKIAKKDIPSDRLVAFFCSIVVKMSFNHLTTTSMKTVDDFKVLLHDLHEKHNAGEFGKTLFPADCGITEENEIYYTAPELTDDKPDARSDIFTATALFYTFLTGHAPWGGCCDSIHSPRQRKVMLRLQRQISPLDMSSIPAALQPIIQKGLAIKPTERYATAEDMFVDLECLSPYELEEPPAPSTDVPSATSTAPDRKQKMASSHPSWEDSSSSFVFHKGSGEGFKDIAGMEDIKTMLNDDVLFVLRNREQAQRYRLDTLNGILLYGPPGCGKTYLAEKFAEEAGTNYILVKASDLGSPYIHGSQEKIAQLFRQAKKNAPAVVCLDEFDAMAPDRSSRSGEHTANEVNEFLTHLNNCAHDGIFVIALTNRPDKIDPAVLRSGRLDKMIYVPLPDNETRKEIFHIHLQGRPCEDDKLDWNKLSSLSDGYVSSDIALVVNDAARKAARKNQLITEDMLEESLHRISPSVKSDMVKYYNQLRLQMEHGKDARPMIGFR